MYKEITYKNFSIVVEAFTHHVVVITPSILYFPKDTESLFYRDLTFCWLKFGISFRQYFK